MRCVGVICPSGLPYRSPVDSCIFTDKSNTVPSLCTNKDQAVQNSDGFIIRLAMKSRIHTVIAVHQQRLIITSHIALFLLYSPLLPALLMPDGLNKASLRPPI